MISVVDLYNSVKQASKTGTSGYQTVEEFNRDLNAVQIDLLTTFRMWYESNQMVRDVLAPFVKTAPISINLPSDYYSFISAVVNNKPSWPISNNEVAVYSSSPVRSPSASGQSYHYFVDGTVKFLTTGSPSGTMVYLRRPSDASVVGAVISDDDSDYISVSSGVNLEWPESVFNIFLYKMLERLGLEMKESLLIEYSRYGIQLETIKTQ